MMGTSKRKSAKSSRSVIDEEDLDSSLSFSHIPMHVHLEETGSQNEIKRSPSQEKMERSMGLKGDHSSIAVLTFLYVLQGIPLGLAGSIPYLLQSRKVNYQDQAIYSFVYWPFSMKLLWAPIVDSVYFTALGRRKSWLVPVQYLIGLFMYVLSKHIGDLLGDYKSTTEENAGAVDVKVLTVIFFMLNFLAATQDIAVDGWALTMLSRRNVGWASTCNTVGQTTGYFLGNIVFLALESPDFCNTYLRSEPHTEGVVTLSGFLYFWGVVFLVTTTLVLLLKRESTEVYTIQTVASSDDLASEDTDLGIVDTYLVLWKIIKLPAIMTLVGVLLTIKMGFAAADSVTGLKLIEAGIPKEKLALMGVPMVPIQIMLPILLSKYTAGPRPMTLLIRAMPFRLVMGLVFAGIVWWTPTTRLPDGTFPLYLYVVIVVVYGFHQIALYSMFVSMMGFFAKISDPAIGGTYMTLLNTISNFGGNWPSTVALWLVDFLTWRTCLGGEGSCPVHHTGPTVCEEGGGECVTTIDGYFIESFICIIIGIVWLFSKRQTLLRLQNMPESHWSCS